MKILVVHQFYLMPGQAGGSRFNEFARLWSERGHEVTVIAGAVSYQTGQVGSTHRGERFSVEREGAVLVIRCPTPATFSRGFTGRALAFAGFAAAASWAVLRAERPDVIVASSPPLPVCLPGFVAARRFRVPWVFEVRDLWPESAITTGVIPAGSPFARALYAIERQACARADAINVLTPAFRDDLVARGLASADKIWFVPNGADVCAFQPGPRDNRVRREFGWGERFVALYAGAHGRANALSQLLDAAERLRAHPDILIACVGDGPERADLERRRRELGLGNIAFYGPQSKDSMPEFVRAADAGLAVLQNNPTFRTVYPNKVFDYMACARPSVLAIDGVARRLVCEEAQAGVFVEPENADALASALVQLSRNPGQCRAFGDAGRRWVLTHATREALADRYLDLLLALTQSTNCRSRAGVRS